MLALPALVLGLLRLLVVRSSLSLLFGSFWLEDAAGPSAVTLVTVDIGVYVFAGFVARLITTSDLTVFFGLAARRDHQKAKQRLEDIKAGRPAYPTE